MPIGLCARLRNGKHANVGVNLDEEILRYFSNMDKYVWISSLNKIDPYDDVKLNVKFIDGLLNELPVFLDDVKNRQIASPPQRVATYGSDNPIHGISFGWPDLENLIIKMIEVLEYGKTHGSVWTEGD